MIGNFLDFLTENLEKVLIGIFVAVVAIVLGWLIYQLRPISGTVTDKDFIPAHYEQYTTEQCTTVGKMRSCVSTPHLRYVRDRWAVLVCNDERCKWVDMTKIRWDDTQLDSYFSEEK